MNKNCFRHLCLICSNYSCQQEGLHKKYTLSQIQQILVELTQLEVCFEQRNNQLDSDSNCSLMKQYKQPFLINKTSFSNMFPKTENAVQNCVKKIKKTLAFQTQSNHLQNNSLQSLILATLSSIFCLEIISNHPLIYHDIRQLIKLIGKSKLDLELENQQQFSIPITQNRIKKTVRQLQKILNSKKEFCNKNTKFNPNQGSNNQNVFNNLSNINLSANRNNNNQNSKICSESLKHDKNEANLQRKLINQVLNEQKTLNKLINSIKSVSQQTYLSNYRPQSLKQVFTYFLSQISNVQNQFSKKLLKHKENQRLRINYEKNLVYLNQNKQNLQFEDNFIFTYLNPEKCSQYIEQKQTFQHKKLNKKTRFNYQEQADSFQVAFIEHIPFPVTRRSIEFSMLQITDDLLLSYLPSIQKFKDLQQICIRKNKLTIFGYKLLKNSFPKLRSLDIRDNLLSQETIEIIVQFTSLNILYISECEMRPASLIKICLNLQNLNILYCDNLQMIQQKEENLDFRGIFYIMCLNLKKLLFLSIKGYFCPKFQQYLKHISSYFNFNCQKNLHQNIQQKFNLTQNQLIQLPLLKNISQALVKRHGILQI